MGNKIGCNGCEGVTSELSSPMMLREINDDVYKEKYNIIMETKPMD